MTPPIVIMRYPPSSVETTYRWECSFCESFHEESWLGETTVHPDHPGYGWRQIGLFLLPSVWICPKHTVVITVDGKEMSG